METVTTVTTLELNKQLELIAELRAKEAEAKAARDAITQELEQEESKMLEMLGQSDLTSYRGPAGMASISFRTSVKTPKTPEQRAAFFEYLKKVGVYDAMITVNSQTLNSFYKSQLEQAKEDGLEDFRLPGVDEVTINPILSFRK